MKKKEGKQTEDTTTHKPNGPTEGATLATDKIEQKTQPNFLIQRLFTKGITFDAPNLSTIFGKEWKPELDINIQTSNRLLSNDLHEVELNVTVNGKMDKQPVFTLGVKQVGIFSIQNFTKEQLDAILGNECLRILYPYARETITDLTSRATLPQLYLTPINFDLVYAQQLQQQQAQKEGKKG